MCRSSAGDDAAPARLSIEDASKVLGVSPTDGFETVLKAKNRLVELTILVVVIKEHIQFEKTGTRCGALPVLVPPVLVTAWPCMNSPVCVWLNPYCAF